MDEQRTPSTGAHPVLACVAGIEELLKSTSGVDPVFMAAGDKREALLGLATVCAQLESLRLRVMVGCADVARDDGMPNVAAWLNPRTLDDPGRNHRSEQLAEALDRRWTTVAAALAEGALNLAQTTAIVSALDNLHAADIDPDVLAQAEAMLVGYGRAHGPRTLRVLGRKILSTLDPELFEDEERRRLEEEERRANARARVWFTRRGDGTVELRATISEVAASRLRSTLDAITSPRHNHTAAGSCPLADPATGQKVPHDQRQGLALQTLLESLDPEHLPLKAGAGTTLVITMDYADLAAGVGVGTLPDGTPISVGQVRRLACQAGIIPAVLGGESEVLDLGRMGRFFSGKQHLALRLQHATCRAEGCLVPAEWCEAHHDQPWSLGGPTDLAHGKLLCPWHHHRAHDQTYQVKLLPNGDVRFRRRT
jgi:hypothetical protein